MKEDPLQLFTKLKKEKERLQEEKSRLEGKLERVLSQLREVFSQLGEEGCGSLEEGRELSLQLKREEEKLRRKFTLLLEKYQQKWGGDSGG